jgi:hypothetical protein
MYSRISKTCNECKSRKVRCVSTLLSPAFFPSKEILNWLCSEVPNAERPLCQGCKVSYHNAHVPHAGRFSPMRLSCHPDSWAWLPLWHKKKTSQAGAALFGRNRPCCSVRNAVIDLWRCWTSVSRRGYGSAWRPRPTAIWVVHEHVVGAPVHRHSFERHKYFGGSEGQLIGQG